MQGLRNRRQDLDGRQETIRCGSWDERSTRALESKTKELTNWGPLGVSLPDTFDAMQFSDDVLQQSERQSGVLHKRVASRT